MRIAGALEGGQLVNDGLLLTPIPEVFNFLTEQQIFQLEEANGVGMVKLKRHRFLTTLPGQVEETLGLVRLILLTMKGFVPLMDLLTIGIQRPIVGRGVTEAYLFLLTVCKALRVFSIGSRPSVLICWPSQPPFKELHRDTVIVHCETVPLLLLVQVWRVSPKKLGLLGSGPG